MYPRNFIKILFFLIILTIITGFVSLSIGSADISFYDLINIILGKTNSFKSAIIYKIRLPRILLAFVIGGSLSISGVLLQTLFKNPLVEPYTLGLSGGASLGVSIAIFFGLGNLYFFPKIIAGFIGAVLVIFILYYFFINNRYFNLQGIVLIGVMISFVTTSLVMLIMALSEAQTLQKIIFWIMGNLDVNNIKIIIYIYSFSIISLIISYYYCIDLNALMLGEKEALSLGVNVNHLKKVIFILASILTAASVSICGIIGFIGLVIPHITKNIFNIDHRIILISSYILGGVFLIISDCVARIIISPLELPVGIITGIIGGFLFIFLYAKKCKG